MSNIHAEMPAALKVLFDKGDWTCFAEAPRDTKVTPVYDCSNWNYNFFSINPLLQEDTMPVEEWHSKMIPRRADVNVAKFRNILIEVDKLSLEEQVQHMEKINLPFSTCVYSGGKSYHWIISLVTPCPNRNEYDALVKRIYHAVGVDIVDRTCKNPSRFSRFPEAYRKDKDTFQTTKLILTRVDNQHLETWLNSKDQPKIVEEWENLPRRATRPKDPSSLFPATRNFLMFGAKENWNIALFSSACDLARNGWSVEEARERLKNITGTFDSNDEKALKSAYKAVQKDNL